MGISREQLRVPQLATAKERVPELLASSAPGGDDTVTIRALYAEEYWSLTDAARNAGGAHRWFAGLLSLAVVDDAGEPLMSEQEWLAFSSAHRDRFTRLAEVAIDLSGLRKGEAEKNSGATQS